jgi:hypothetical protein
MSLVFCCCDDGSFLTNDFIFNDWLLAGGRRARDNLVLDLHDWIDAHD